MKPDRGARRPGAPPRGDPHAERAHQANVIAKRSGLPLELARQVAAGRLDLDAAIQRMAFRDQVESLIQRHALDRALATQVAMGQVQIESVLARRRREAHLRDNQDRSVLAEAAAKGSPITIGEHGHATKVVRVLSVDKYEVRLVDVDTGAEELLHKTAVKFAFAPDDQKKVRKALDYDKERRARTVDPKLKPQDRYACSNRRLAEAWEAKQEVVATTVEGERFTGRVEWISRYEIGLLTKHGAALTIFRHALDDFGPA
jgi:sRNA-binding regulator protein Hfq